jgi:hypothetical protein
LPKRLPQCKVSWDREIRSSVLLRCLQLGESWLISFTPRSRTQAFENSNGTSGLKWAMALVLVWVPLSLGDSTNIYCFSPL